MATLVETKVSATVTLSIAADGSRHANVSGNAMTATGAGTRGLADQDVTSLLTPDQTAAAVLLLNAAEAYLKSQFQIA